MGYPWCLECNSICREEALAVVIAHVHGSGSFPPRDKLIGLIYLSNGASRLIMWSKV